MEREYVLTVRKAPQSVNAKGGGSRANPYVAAREKKQWEGIYLAEMMVERVAKDMERCEVSIVVNWRRDNHRDVENYRHPVVKPLADSLVKGGYLHDDTEHEFTVASFGFAYPKPFRFALLDGYMTINLRATYA